LGYKQVGEKSVYLFKPRKDFVGFNVLWGGGLSLLCRQEEATENDVKGGGGGREWNVIG